MIKLYSWLLFFPQMSDCKKSKNHNHAIVHFLILYVHNTHFELSCCPICGVLWCSSGHSECNFNAVTCTKVCSFLLCCDADHFSCVLCVTMAKTRGLVIFRFRI